MKAILNKLTVLSFATISMTAFSSTGFAQQSSSELTCRAKAKEIAAQTYSSCVTDARSAQIEQIRKDYQKQLTELKSKYDRELKRMGSKEALKDSGSGTTGTTTPTSTKEPNTNTKEGVTSTDITISTKKALKEKKKAAGYKPKATKGVAKSLPTRKEVVALPPPVIQESTEETTVVTPDTPMSSDENAAQDEMQLTLVPASEPTSALMEQ